MQVPDACRRNFVLIPRAYGGRCITRRWLESAQHGQEFRLFISKYARLWWIFLPIPFYLIVWCSSQIQSDIPPFLASVEREE